MSDQTTLAFLDALAAKNPTPAGGAAAAYAGAMAAALVQMVARTTIGKAGYEKVWPDMEVVAESAGQLRHSLEQGVEKDSAAFEAMLAARRLPEGAKRTKAIRDTAHDGANVPIAIAEDAVTLMMLGKQLIIWGNRSAMSDAFAALMLAQATVHISCTNAYENLAAVGSPRSVDKLVRHIVMLESTAQEIVEQAAEFMDERSSTSL